MALDKQNTLHTLRGQTTVLHRCFYVLVRYNWKQISEGLNVKKTVGLFFSTFMCIVSKMFHWIIEIQCRIRRHCNR